MAIGAIEPAAGAVASVSRSRVAWLVFALVVAAIPVTLVFPETDEALGVLGVMIGHITAGLLFTRGGISIGGKEGRAWRFVGAGYLTTGFGVLLVAIANTAVGAVNAFGPQDVVFMSGYMLIFIGLASLPHVTGNVTERLRVWLDGLIGAVSLGSLMWVVYLSDLVGDAINRVSIWERIAGFGYPVLDAISLIVVMIVVVRRGSLRFDVRLMVFAAALIAQGLADLTFLSGLGESWDDATPVFAFYLIAVAGYLLAALLVTNRPQPREYADRRHALIPMLAPYGAAVVLVTVLFFRIVGSALDTLTVELLVATLIVGGLVVGRQAVAIRQNRQLVERQRAALVSSISHELRTPLTAMMGFLEVLGEDGSTIDDVEQRELTSIVHQQAVYMSRIVADLIMLARGNPGEIDLAAEPTVVLDAIGAAIKSVPDAESSTDVSCAADLVVLADPDRLQQVLVNLLVNAVRYGGDYRAVVARVERDDVVIEVHDNGPGVPARYALTIWERFERGPNRFNATNPGSGIGLAVVEAVARAHGGTAEYRRSPLLGGACFRVRLPARRVVSDPTRSVGPGARREEAAQHTP